MRDALTSYGQMFTGRISGSGGDSTSPVRGTGDRTEGDCSAYLQTDTVAETPAENARAVPPRPDFLDKFLEDLAK